MTVYIIAVQMSPPSANSHEHIAYVKWEQPDGGGVTVSSRAQMVSWINQGGDARVRDPQGEVQVGVVDANPPYLRTYADNRYTDNLLSLPRF
jgi:hypothetical protein